MQLWNQQRPNWGLRKENKRCKGFAFGCDKNVFKEIIPSSVQFSPNAKNSADATNQKYKILKAVRGNENSSRKKYWR